MVVAIAAMLAVVAMFVLWMTLRSETISASGVERQIESLRTQLPRLREHLAGVGALDLRFERYIVVQPVKER